MAEISKVILTNMCLIYHDDEFLVCNRSKTDWPGITFPGGHVENDETCLEAVIREMKEETNLDIKNPKLIGTIEWPWGNNTRYLALLYLTNEFKGTLKSSNEGECIWIKKEDLSKFKFSTDFDKILEIYKNYLK